MFGRTVLCLWPCVGSRLTDSLWNRLPSSRSLSSLSFFPWRILIYPGSFWNLLIGAVSSMLLCIVGGRGVSLPVAIVAEAKGCGAVTSGFVQKL